MSDSTIAGERERQVGSSRTLVIFLALVALSVAMTALVLIVSTGSVTGSRSRSRSSNPTGAPTPIVDVTLNEFSVIPSQFASAPAGDVTFVVKNAGGIDHEMIVVKTDTPFNKLPIVDGGDPPVPVKSGADKVDEGASVGETGGPDLKPGRTRTFTIKHLVAGNYVLFCNIAKHYGLGMRAAFTVD